jgi:hypothetical protein
MAKRTPKTKMICVVQGYYSGRWEDLTAGETRQECRADYRAYRENETGAFRIINRRVKRS